MVGQLVCMNPKRGKAEFPMYEMPQRGEDCVIDVVEQIARMQIAQPNVMSLCMTL